MDDTSPEMRSYGFARSFQTSIYVFMVLFWGMAAGTLYVGIFSRSGYNPNTPGVIALALIFATLGYYCIDILPRIHSRILLGDQQIIQEFKNGERVTIAWGELEHFRPRVFLGRIELHAANPRREIHIETQIQGFGEITRTIRERLAAHGTFRGTGRNS